MCRVCVSVGVEEEQEEQEEESWRCFRGRSGLHVSEKWFFGTCVFVCVWDLLKSSLLYRL